MKKIKKRWIVLAILVIAVIGGVASSGGNDDSSNKGTDNQPSEVKKDKFTVEGETTSSIDTLGFMSIEGTIKNNTDKDATYVQVQFNIYDKDGNQIGSAIDNINNLEAGGTWKFKAISLTEGGETYKLAEISGF